MKKAEIVVSMKYWVKVSGRIVPVLVNAVRETFGGMAHHNGRDVYDCTNTVTDRKLVFRSAAKFRSAFKVKPVPAINFTPTLNEDERAATMQALKPITDTSHPEGL